MKSFQPTIFPEERGNSVRRIITLILALLLAAFLTTAGAAESTETDGTMPGTLNISYFEENGEYFRTEVSEDGTTAYIQTKASAENRAFFTPYENDRYYSAVFPELVISNWDREAERVPVFRSDPLPRNKAPEHRGCFPDRGWNGLPVPGRFLPGMDCDKGGRNSRPGCPLVLGSDRNNAVCFATLFSGAVEYTQSRMNNPETPQPDISMILHGDEEDIPVTLPADFWSEMAMFVYSLDSINGFSCLTTIPGTPCMVQK